jgi:hypothetical protein
MTHRNGNVWLILAGTGAFLGGLLHVLALIGGPEWIAFLRAPEWAVESARQGTWIAPVGAMAITGLMWLCSTYAFSGAGRLRKLPLLRTALFSISFVCMVRGVILIPLVLMYPALLARIGTFDIAASLIWLAIGVFFGLGLHGVGKQINAQRPTDGAQHRLRSAQTGQQTVNPYLLWSGVGIMLGGLVHVAVIFGGPAWYAFIGAPDSIVDMVRAGRRYPVVACLVIAAFLFVCAGYAFSGAGVIRRLPFLRTGLTLIAIGLLLRAIGFIPLMLLRPRLFAGICNCKGVDTLVIVTSAICFSIGVGYAVGTRNGWRRLSAQRMV